MDQSSKNKRRHSGRKNKGPKGSHSNATSRNNANTNSTNNSHSKPAPLPNANRKKLVVISEQSNLLTSHAAFSFFNCKLSVTKKVNWKLYDVMVLIVPKQTHRRPKEDFVRTLCPYRVCLATHILCL